MTWGEPAAPAEGVDILVLIARLQRLAFGCLSSLPRAAGAAVTLFAAVVLVGWVLGVDGLKSIRPGYIAMNPVTALTFALAGASLFVRGEGRLGRRLALGSAIAVAAVGAAKLAELAAGYESGIDQWLFARELRGNRIAPNTAINFLLCGLALLACRSSRPAFGLARQVLASGSAGLSALAIVGYWQGIPVLYGVTDFVPMALHTASTFVVLSLGILLVRHVVEEVPHGAASGDSTAGLFSGGWLKAKVAIGFGAALLILGVVGVVSVRSTGLLLQHAREDDQTHKELAALRDVLSLLKDAQTGERGFVIVGDPAYLAPYEAAVQALPARIEFVQESLADDPEQAGRWGHVRRMIDAELEVLRHQIALREHGGFEPARAAVAAGTGRRLMNQIRAAIGEMVLTEEARLRERATRLDHSARVAVRVIPAGSVLALVVVGAAGWLIRRDIGARQRAEDALRLSEQRTRLIIETALDAVVTMDANGRVSGWNGQAEQMFGWRAGEAIGRAVHELIVPQHLREAHIAGIRRFLNSGEHSVLNRRVEIPALHRAGHEFPAEFSVTPMRVGETYAFAAFIRDISERKRAESVVKKAKEAAEAANQAKSTFLANMSHEIRTPMNGVLGMIDLMLATTLNSKQKRFAETVRQSGQNLLRIVNEILDFAKVEAGRLTLEQVEFDVYETIEEVIDLVAESAQSKGLTLACEIDEQVPAMLKGDPGRLRQILINLIGNAIKFTEHGEVVVRVHVEAGSQETPQSDDGALVPSEDEAARDNH